jgi:hypothetical protein
MKKKIRRRRKRRRRNRVHVKTICSQIWFGEHSNAFHKTLTTHICFYFMIYEKEHAPLMGKRFHSIFHTNS